MACFSCKTLNKGDSGDKSTVPAAKQRIASSHTDDATKSLEKPSTDYQVFHFSDSAALLETGSVSKVERDSMKATWKGFSRSSSVSEGGLYEARFTVQGGHPEESAENFALATALQDPTVREESKECNQIENNDVIDHISKAKRTVLGPDEPNAQGDSKKRTQTNDVHVIDNFIEAAPRVFNDAESQMDIETEIITMDDMMDVEILP